MRARWYVFLLPVAITVFAAGEPGWKTRRIPDWSVQDAQQVLTDSPWVMSVAPKQQGSLSTGRNSDIDVSGLGVPVGRHGRHSGEDDGEPPILPSTVRLRWESALPVREAELKTQDVTAPVVDEDHYAIAIYGVPRSIASADSKGLPDRLKREAFLKRNGKRDLKPSRVEVLQREDGPVLIYLFPKSVEITAEDRSVEFDAHIGPLAVAQTFSLADMVYQGKLEL